MVSILLTLNAIICVALIILILLQRSDPASGGMFGGAGGGGQPVVRNPMARPTAILAALFLLFSVLAAVLNKGGGHDESVMNNVDTHTPSLPEAALLPVGAVSATTEPVVSTTIITTPTTAPSPTK
jgi:preprotein translocase subunit SecG